MFSKYIIKQTFEEHSHKNAINITLDEQGETENTTEQVVLPYHGIKIGFILKSMKNKFDPSMYSPYGSFLLVVNLVV